MTWIMTQSWQRQLFAHWPVPESVLRPLVPAALDLDLYNGTAYVGITPFDLRNLRFRFLPELPFGSNFTEVNLRTYVRVNSVPGVFFFSLDAASHTAVVGARLSFQLPYYDASMRIAQQGEWIEYGSRRRGNHAELEVRYRPTGPAYHAAPGTLDHFLTERYSLFVVFRGGTVMRGDIRHMPWNLQPAEAEFDVNTIPAAHGITLPNAPPILHYSARQDSELWAPVDARRPLPQR